MYRSVIYSLLALLVVATGLSLFGFLPFNPLVLIAGAAVLVVSSVVANYGLAYVFGTRGHVESAIITGLIMVFMFSPPQGFEGYASFVLLGIIAMATKYVFAWRGRHIANPAALAAVIVLFAGLQAATWWVATGPMLLVTIVFGTYLLYKTNRIIMGYLYIVTAAVVTIAVTLLQGGTLGSILPVVFVSYPILYLAYYMLSEPLTQAPRNYQRNLIAVGIAILASAQIVIFGRFITPEIALVIGNIVAFAFTQRSSVTLTYLRKETLASQQVAYYFTPRRKLQFTAGQYIELTLHHGNADARGYRRMFTIASSPDDDELFIAVRCNDPSSSFKTALDALTPGTKLRGTGIYGDFLLPSSIDEKILMIAGGIGITPFLSHLKTMQHRKEKRDVHLLYFVNDVSAAVKKDLLKAAKASGVTVELVTEHLTEALLKKKVTDITERVVYASGPPRMVEAAKKTAKSLGAKKVTTDLFTGY